MLATWETCSAAVTSLNEQSKSLASISPVTMLQFIKMRARIEVQFKNDEWNLSQLVCVHRTLIKATFSSSKYLQYKYAGSYFAFTFFSADLSEVHHIRFIRNQA